jgi:hypothetical protein
MADNPTQRPHRSNEPPARGAPSANIAAGDPLAELARLIGQNDPFAEFGQPRRAAPAQAAEPAANWAAAPAAHQAYAETPYAAEADQFHGTSETPGYHAAPADAYDSDAFHMQREQQAGAHDDYYDDAPSPRRRMGIMAIAAVFALAVVGTAGALGYRALFGTSGTRQPPPVIKADSTPSKIVPANANKAPSKAIYDRVADHAQDEKVVSREEQPIDMKPPNMAMTPASDSAQPADNAPPPMGSGVISSEPKKVRTIVIHPGRPDSTPAAAAEPAAPPPMNTEAPARAAPPRVASAAPMPTDEDAAAARRQRDARALSPVHRAAPPAPGNAPLSLNPNADAAEAAAPAPRAPARTAAVTASTQAVPPRSAASGGSYAVQVSSQRSEAEAQASFRSLQAKYPNQLGGRQAMIHRVDLGAKGTYYRALVGPFANAEEANSLCSDLKAAGGQCLIQRN